MNPQHLSLSNEHYAPPIIAEACRAMMGGIIGLDPASCHYANLIVQAEKYYTWRDNGLLQPWKSQALFLNPPGGKVTKKFIDDIDGYIEYRETQSMQALWFDVLVRRWIEREVYQACFIAFNQEIMARDKRCSYLPHCHILRPEYWSYNDETQQLMAGQWSYPPKKLRKLAKELDKTVQNLTIAERDSIRTWGSAPTHSTVVFYLPPLNKWADTEIFLKFMDLFTPLGNAIVPYRYTRREYRDRLYQEEAE